MGFPAYSFIVIILTAVNFIGESTGDDFDSNLFFRKNIITKIVRIGEALPIEQTAFLLISKLEKTPICLQANLAFQWFYNDDDYEPQIHNYRIQYENGTKEVVTAVDCASVPATYLRLGKLSNEIIGLFVKSVAGSYRTFKDKDDELSTLITLTSKEPNSNPLDDLDIFSRQSLCIDAMKFFPHVFVDNYVFRAQTYTFYTDLGMKNKRAVLCPTYPPTYLIGKSNKEIMTTWEYTIFKMVVVEKIRFGENGEQPENIFNKMLLTSWNETARRDYCKLLLLYMHEKVNLSDSIDEARLYEFDFGRGVTRKEFAISCTPENDLLGYYTGSLYEGGRVNIVHLKDKLMEKSVPQE